MSYEVKLDWGSFYPTRVGKTRVSLKTVGPITVYGVKYEGQIFLDLGASGWKVIKVALSRSGGKSPATKAAIQAVSEWAEGFVPLWVEPDRVKAEIADLKVSLPNLKRRWDVLKAELAKAEAELNAANDRVTYLEYHWPKIDRPGPPHPW